MKGAMEPPYREILLKLLKDLNYDDDRGEVAGRQMAAYKTLGMESDQCQRCYGVFLLDELSGDKDWYLCDDCHEGE